MIKNYVEAEMKIMFFDLESDVITASGLDYIPEFEDNDGVIEGNENEWDGVF